MDDLTIHTGACPRLHPGPVPLLAAGWHYRRQRPTMRPVSTCNLQIILRGEGTLSWNGRVHPLVAPCAFLRLPGVECRYQPTTTWDEVFLVYAHDAEPVLQARRLLFRERPCWYLNDGRRLRQAAGRLRELIEHRPLEAWIDRIDRAAEDLWLESWSDTSSEPTGDDALAHLHRLVDSAYPDAPDWSALAAVHGLTVAALRHRWNRAGHPPLRRWHEQLRLGRAARSVAEEDAPLHVIAATHGFADALYFSRRFKQVHGCTPSSYRARHRDPDRG